MIYFDASCKTLFLRTICKFRDVTEDYVIKWFSNERVSGEGLEYSGKGEERNFPIHLLSSITAHRGYNIPCNFSDRTMRAGGTAEFISSWYFLAVRNF